MMLTVHSVQCAAKNYKYLQSGISQPDLILSENLTLSQK